MDSLSVPELPAKHHSISMALGSGCAFVISSPPFAAAWCPAASGILPATTSSVDHGTNPEDVRYNQI
jgi:hypothetical protein